MAQVSLARKKELMEPDEFEVFLRNLLEKAIQYKNQLIVGAIVIAVLVLSVSGYLYKLKSNEKSASLALSSIVNEYEKETKVENIPTGLINKFQNLLDEYSGTETAKFACVRYANACYSIGNYDKAISLYKDALKDFKKNEAITNIITCGLGYAYIGKKDFEAAKNYFEQISSGSSEVMKEEALFNLGLIYESLNDKTKSLENYNKIIAGNNNSLYLDLVKEKVLE